jgi:serine beta-lactamase-like protein LACTB, mitochondrial
MQVSRRSLLLGSTALAATAHAASADKRRVDAARAVVRTILDAEPIPALSIAVVHGESLIWAEAFGKADLELDVAATTAHRFRLGSVAKVFTATLAAVLADRGVVDLDAPIANYLPDLPLHHRATTLRQLLTHRGGVRHYADKDWQAPNATIDQRIYPTNKDILAIFIEDPLIAKPGERVSYSTFGYTLASLVLEAAAKTPFLTLLQREIAEPHGVPSLAPDAPRTITPNRVSGYTPRASTKYVFPPIEGPFANASMNNSAYKWAGGGLIATPADIARFGAAHFTPGRLSRGALRELFTVLTQPTESSAPLGLGWRIDSDPAQRLRWHHAGGQDGARASLVVYPKEKLSIAFATNVMGAPRDVNGPSARIADALLGA